MWILLGLGYFNRTDPKIAHSYIEIGMDVTFWATLQNRKPQMPSSASPHSKPLQRRHVERVNPLIPEAHSCEGRDKLFPLQIKLLRQFAVWKIPDFYCLHPQQ